MKKKTQKKAVATGVVRQSSGSEAASCCACCSRTPVQIVHGGSMASGTVTLPQTRYTVPAGKRLAIEFVSVTGSVPDGQRLGGAVGTIVNRVIAYYQFPSTAYPTTPAYRTDSVGNQPVSLYADPGTVVTIWAARTGGSAGQAVAQVALSGCLFDA